jgi:hypothetical protein
LIVKRSSSETIKDAYRTEWCYTNECRIISNKDINHYTSSLRPNFKVVKD